MSFAVATASLREQLALIPAHTASLQLLFDSPLILFLAIRRSSCRSALVFSRMPICCRSVSSFPGGRFWVGRDIHGVSPFGRMRTLLGLRAPFRPSLRRDQRGPIASPLNMCLFDDILCGQSKFLGRPPFFGNTLGFTADKCTFRFIDVDVKEPIS